MITDLAIDSHIREATDGIVNEQVVFSFTLPFIPSPFDPLENFLSGFQLFRNGVVVLETLVTDETFVEVNGSTVLLTYDFNDVPGQTLTFVVKYVDLDTIYSVDSNSISLESTPSPVESIESTYHRNFVRVVWSSVTGNPNFQNYTLVRAPMIEYKLENGSIIENIEPDLSEVTITFTSPITGLIRGVYKDSSWKATIINSNSVTFTIDQIERFGNPDLRYQDIEKYRFFIYFGSTFSDVVTLPTTNIISTSSGILYYYDDPTVLADGRYVHAIKTNGLAVSNTFYEIFSDIDVRDKEPKILSWGFQSSEFLNNEQWRQMKNVLVDKNIYDKDYYAIPYLQSTSTGTTHILDGYVGIGDEQVEVHLNGTFREEVVASSTGYFSFAFKPKLGTNKLRLTTSTPTFPRSSRQYEISTYNIYSTFSTQGRMILDADTVAQQVRSNFFLDDVDQENIGPNFANEINLKYSPTIDEDFETFRTLVKGIRKAHLDFGMKESMDTVLQAFSSYYSKYEIYERDSHVNTTSPYTSQIVDNPDLQRADYYYGITAISDRNAETAHTLINRDKRWWLFFQTNGIALKWDPAEGAVNYKIYRGCEADELEYMITTSAGITAFVDNGTISSSTGIAPPTFNFSPISNVSNVREYHTGMNLDNFFLISSKTIVTVIVYTDIQPYPELILNRIFRYLSYAVGTLKLRLIIASDLYIILKEQDDTAIMFVEGNGINTILNDLEVGASLRPWIAISTYFYADIEHNLNTDNLIPRAKLQSNGQRVIPGFRRMSDNVLRVFWNTSTDILEVDIVSV